MRRFERPTLRLGGECSILLSYMGIWNFAKGILPQNPASVNCFLFHFALKSEYRFLQLRA